MEPFFTTKPVGKGIGPGLSISRSIALEHGVLIVDDEPMLLEIFGEWLQEENCRVLTAGDGAAALQISQSHHVDVIVSDVRMPVVDGILLLKNLTTYTGLSKSNYRPRSMIQNDSVF